VLRQDFSSSRIVRSRQKKKRNRLQLSTRTRLNYFSISCLTKLRMTVHLGKTHLEEVNNSLSYWESARATWMRF